MATRCVFIDETVQNSQTLLAGLEVGDICYRLDRQRDGLHQIATLLAGHQNLETLLIFAHGQPGVVQLGTLTLAEDNLTRYQDELAAIGQALTPDGGIQLYACDLGRGRKGEAFVAAIEEATGFPCAAASTPVGHANLGGSWALDVGHVSASTFANPHWNGILGLTIIENRIAFPGHSSGEFLNSSAFAALRADGSVVTWGYDQYGGDSGAVAHQIDGTTDVTQIFSTLWAFAALRTDGSVVTWGYDEYGGNSSAVARQIDGTIDVTQIFSTRWSFAALLADGSVATWGNSLSGGDSSNISSQINGTIDVTQIFSTSSAFAALRADGSVVTWGDVQYGGDSRTVANQLNGLTNITQISSTISAFAALRADGSVITWGNSLGGGGSSAVARQIDGTIDVAQIFSTSSAFAALRDDGSVVTWGDNRYGGNSSAVSIQIDGTIDVTQIISTSSAFAALRADGSIITWGDVRYGGDSSAVALALDGTVGVSQIVSTGYAFAALRADGSVVTWGDTRYGGDSSTIASTLDGTIDVTRVVSTGSAFAALRADGSVVTWGDSLGGGDSSAVASALDGTIEIRQIFSTSYGAFAALRADGSVVTWGDTRYGGNSCAVADQLTDVVSMADPYTDDVYHTETHATPVIVAPLSDRTVRERMAFSFQLPTGSFSDADGDTLSYSAALPDGTALPSWLLFNLTTRTFSGIAPAESPDYTIRVTASDNNDGSVYDDFVLTTAIQPATLAITASSASQSEGNSGSTLFTFTVTRSGNSAISAGATWSVAGTGSSPANADDFIGNLLPSGTVAFAPNQTSQTITIPVVGDRTAEMSEGFTVALSNPSANTMITTANAGGIIQNDDGAPATLTIASSAASYSEGNNGRTSFIFIVTRSGNSAIAAGADWSVTGTGSSPANAEDFIDNELPCGTVFFAAGQNSQTITISVAGDRMIEASEGFTVTLSSPFTNTMITTACASSVIQNDDILPATLEIAASTPSCSEGNNGSTPFTFTVTRSGNTAIAASAAWSVTGGGSDPTNAADFLGNVFPSGTVAFAAGQTSQTITIHIASDRSIEASEGFTVTLSTPSTNTTITTAQASGVIQNDDIAPATLALAASTTSRAEGNSGSTAFTFTVIRSGNSAIAASAAWSVTGNGSNPANAADFLGNVLPSGTVAFAAGQTSQSITVKVAGDRTVEASEGFTVALSAPSPNTTITTAQANGLIQNDDSSPMANAIIMTAVDGDNHTREDGGLATYRLSLNTPLTDGSLKIDLTSLDPSEGLFLVNCQHTSSQTILFDATHQSATVTVWGVQDYDPDGSASYQIQASASAGSTPPTSATGSWTSAIRTFNGGTSASNAHHETLYNDPDLTPDGGDRDVAVYLVGDQTGPTDDNLVGYDGPDRLYGQFMPDLLDGGIGDDRLYGGYDDDILYGRDGNDKLYGEQDDDYLNGGAGNDTLDGGLGADTMVGGVGNDVYFVDDTEDIVNDQGAATDIDTIILTETIRYTLPGTVENARLDSDSGNSGLIGNALKNSLTGNDDNNNLSGGAGNDTLIGNDGNDILTGGLGADRLTGGEGADIFRFAAPSEGGDTLTDFTRGADKIQSVQSAFGGLTARQLAQGRLVCNATGTASGSGAQFIFNNRTGVLTYDGNGTGSGGATTLATLTIRTLSSSDFQMVAS